MRTDRTVPYRLPLLAIGFRSVLVVYVSVSTAVEPGSQPATHVDRASLVVPRSGHGVNPDARLLVRKKPQGVAADTKSKPELDRTQVTQLVWQSGGLKSCELVRVAKEGAAGRRNAEAPEGDGDVGDNQSRRLRRKLRRSVVGGSQGADQGPGSPRRTCAQRQLSENQTTTRGGVRRRQDQRLRGFPIIRS